MNAKQEATFDRLTALAAGKWSKPEEEEVFWDGKFATDFIVSRVIGKDERGNIEELLSVVVTKSGQLAGAYHHESTRVPRVGLTIEELEAILASDARPL